MKFDFHKPEQVWQDFDPAIIFAGFETAQQARRAKQRAAEALDEYGADGRKLARRFNKCGILRCRSAACPVCLRYFRRWWCSQVARYMAQDRNGWYTVCIVPPDLAYPIGELDRFSWNLAKDRLRKQIKRSKLARAIILGGFDYALQDFEGRAPKWRPHIYFLTQTGGKGVIDSALRPHYRPDQDTPRPVVVTDQRKTDKDLVTTATYTFKSDFRQRGPGVDKRGNADTKASPLAPHYESELRLFLHQQSFLGRLIRHGDDESLPLLNMR